MSCEMPLLPTSLQLLFKVRWTLQLFTDPCWPHTDAFIHRKSCLENFLRLGFAATLHIEHDWGLGNCSNGKNQQKLSPSEQSLLSDNLGSVRALCGCLKISSNPLPGGQAAQNTFSVPLSVAQAESIPCLFLVTGSAGGCANKAAGSGRGCQAHGANLGKPPVNTESRQNHLHSEASSDVRRDQVLIKLPEQGSQRGFVLNSDSA